MSALARRNRIAVTTAVYDRAMLRWIVDPTDAHRDEALEAAINVHLAHLTPVAA